jgi:NADPH-dependent curcumin reductase CurA
MVEGHIALDPALAVSVCRHNGAMLIVCGYLVLDPVDRTRVNVFERWAGPADLDAFRVSGASGDETHDLSRIRSFEIEQYSCKRRGWHRLTAGRAHVPP